MENQVVKSEQQAPEMHNPFAGLAAATDTSVNKGVVSIEQSRSVTEAMGQLYLAKQFPRDKFKAYEAIIQDCSRFNLADQAVYSYPRGKTVIKGPSIRLAELLARSWGNIDFGKKELSRKAGESEWLAYAWDMETNVRSTITFTVRHERHVTDDRTKAKKVVPLTDPRDIYEIGANEGGRRLRACILAVIPPDLADAAVEQCMKTLAGSVSKSMEDTIKGMVKAFGEIGISNKHIEERLGKPLAKMLPDEVVELRTIYQSIKDNVSKASDFFGGLPDESQSATAAAGVNKALKKTPETPPPTE